MLLQQIEKLVKETEIRRQNADYLTAQLKQIPGITPARLPENSRAVWHLYPFRYDAQQFNGLPHGRFTRSARRRTLWRRLRRAVQRRHARRGNQLRGYKRLFRANG